MSKYFGQLLDSNNNEILPNCIDSGNTYMKFEDGTMILRGTANVGAISANSTGSVSITFAIPFIATPTIVAVASTTAPMSRIAGVGDESMTGFTAYVGVTYETSGVGVRWIAIGKWK